MVTNCQHVFCKVCIDKWTQAAEQPTTCPMDRQVITGLEALQKPFMDVLNDLEIRCTFHSSGCKEILNLGNLEDHQKLCEANPEFKKACIKDCGAILSKTDIEDHNCIGFLKARIEDLKFRHNTATDYEKIKKKVKIVLRDWCEVTSDKVVALENLKLKIKETRDKLEQFVLKSSVDDWIKDMCENYINLGKALVQMPKEIQSDVVDKYGEWLNDYQLGTFQLRIQYFKI